MSDISAAPLSGVTPDSNIYSRITWRLMPFIVLCYCCAYLDRVNVGFAKLRMVTDLGFSDVIYGLGAGIFFIGYFFFEVPSNLLLHNYGARRWIARIMVSWGIVSGATLLVHTPLQFYIARFLLGATEAGFSPGIMLYLTYWFPARKRGYNLGFYYIAIPLAGVIGGPFSGFILHNFAHSTIMKDWQWLFLLEALPSIVVGVAVWFLMSDRPQTAKWLSADERRQVVDELALEDQGRRVHSGIGSFLRDASIWKLTAVYFCQIVGLYGISFWLPSLIKGAGIHDVATVGYLSAIPYLVSIPAIILSGISADRLRSRRMHFSVALVIGAAGLAASGTAGFGPVLTIIALSVACAGILSALSLFWGVPLAYLTGTSAAAGFAFINSIGNLAGFVSPYMVGWLNVNTGNPRIGLYAVGIFLLIGAVLVRTVSGRLGDR